MIVFRVVLNFSTTNMTECRIMWRFHQHTATNWSTTTCNSASTSTPSTCSWCHRRTSLVVVARPHDRIGCCCCCLACWHCDLCQLACLGYVTVLILVQIINSEVNTVQKVLFLNFPEAGGARLKESSLHLSDCANLLHKPCTETIGSLLV